MSRQVRTAVYDLHWGTLGGGEQVAGAAVEALTVAGHDVTMLGTEAVDAGVLRERLGVDVGGARFREVDGEVGAARASGDYDVFVNVTYRSTVVNRAPRSLYYVHFPEPPRALAGRVGDVVGRAAIAAVDRTPLRAVRPAAVARDEVALRTRTHAFVDSYDRVAGNSHFTNGWIETLWHVEPLLLHPPVRPLAGPNAPAADRRRTIVSVGRFFDARHGHCKKQLELVHAFRALVGSGRAEGWELVLVGGCDVSDRDYLLDVRRAATGLPVTIHANATGAVLRDAVATASLYWHAAGFGEDPARHPERFEHFGIAVVEAMSAGAVPLVLDAAGPAEIVDDPEYGRRWSSLDDLAAATADLAGDDDTRARCSAAARRRAEDFAPERFRRRLREILADLGASAPAGIPDARR